MKLPLPIHMRVTVKTQVLETLSTKLLQGVCVRYAVSFVFRLGSSANWYMQVFPNLKKIQK